jgi:ADP-L-glycero-D-manno-heptose 6-epimerase
VESEATVKRIIVTGGAGFIGSALVWKLNQEGVRDILVVDALGTEEKWKNLVGLRYRDFLHKDEFLRQIQGGSLAFTPDAIVHLGACSATTERDADYLMENNYRYTKTLAEWSIERDVRFLYASSGATYGDGSLGFSDSDSVTPSLAPLNMYGYSKHLFDLYALDTGCLSQLAGIKFFNVFGPNEYHKGSMTSVVYNAFHQIRKTGTVRLFRSNHPNYADGEQRRDFIYVKDCVDVLWWLLQKPKVNGLFNLGTGVSRTWNDLTNAVFAAMGLAPNIEFIDLPEALREKYQYFTEAEMNKLQGTGCPVAFRTLEESVADYVTNYLAKGPAYLRF